MPDQVGHDGGGDGNDGGGFVIRKIIAIFARLKNRKGFWCNGVLEREH